VKDSLAKEVEVREAQTALDVAQSAVANDAVSSKKAIEEVETARREAASMRTALAVREGALEDAQAALAEQKRALEMAEAALAGEAGEKEGGNIRVRGH
jgi:Na+-transporting NADH:ubiquinone oxidoreductase subunit NqrA